MTTPGPTIRRLALDLTADVPDAALPDELAAWLAGSARFRAFVEAYRGKIRHKLRGAADADAVRDVRTELELARRLVADRRVELAFEAYGSRTKGPDFTVTIGGRSFNLEVTRLRRVPDAPGLVPPLLAKLRQLPPSVPNALVVAVRGESSTALDIAGAVRLMRDRADARDEAFLAGHGYDGARAFYDRFLRLGAVFAWCEAGSGDARAEAWRNRSARIPLPERVERTVLTSLRADAIAVDAVAAVRA